MKSPTQKAKSLDFSIPINPFWVKRMMNTARDGDASAEEATKYYTERSHENKEAFDKELRAFVRRRVERSNGSASGHALPFLWFLLSKFNKSQTVKLTLVAIGFIIFRVGYNFAFTQLMAALADDPSAVVIAGTPLPPLGVTIITFVITCLGSSWLAYWVEQIGQNLGNQCRLQIIWSVQSAMLRCTQTSINGFETSEVVSLAGIDGMAIRWYISSIVYMFAVPIELGVLIWLSTTQVGVAAALLSFLPLVLQFAVKMLLVRVSNSQERDARDILSKRLGVLNESIASNSVIKLMGTSPNVLKTLGQLRKMEEKKYMLGAVSNAISLSMQMTVAPLMAWISMMARAMSTSDISSGPIMTVLGYYRTITTFDIYKIVSAIQSLSMAMVAADKYMAFFATEISSQYLHGNASKKGGEDQSQGAATATLAGTDDVPLADLSDVAFTWQVGAKPTLHNLSFKLSHGKLIGVCGTIGSGKSSLLLALLSELSKSAGSMTMHPDWEQPVAYSSQRAWLQTGTVRENICFAEPVGTVDSTWLQTVIECCGLEKDIEGFPEGVDHHIGEAGASLSGGQKARLSLARAVYLQAPITLLDDPLCALDPALADLVFSRLLAEGGLLRGKSRSIVMVTSNPVILKQCDQVIMLKDGTVTASGAFQEADLDLAETQGELSRGGKAPKEDAKLELKAKEKTEASQDIVLTIPGSHTHSMRQDSQVRLHGAGGYQLESMLSASTALDEYIYEEQRLEEDIALKYSDKQPDVTRESSNKNSGKDGVSEALILGVDVPPRSSIGALLYAFGWWRACVGGLLIVIAQAAVYTWQFLLKAWLDGTESPSEFQEMASTLRYLIIPMTVPALLGAVIHYIGFLTGSTRLQAMCSSAVIGASYSFFSLNPASRVFGHISLDSQQVEQPLAMTLGAMWMLCAQLIGSIIITCISLWYLIFLFIPLAVVYYYIQRQYSKAVVPMSNLEAGTRGPVNDAIAATLAGLPIVRSFKKQPRLEQQLSAALLNTGAMSSVVIGCAGWLSFLANVVIFGLIAVVVSVLMALIMEPGPESLGPIVLSNIMSLSGIIGSTAVLLSNVETSFTALQRLVQYAEVPSEEKVVRGLPPDTGKDAESPDNNDSKKNISCSDADIDIEKQQNSSSLAIRIGTETVADADALETTRYQVAILQPPEGWPANGCVECRNAYASYVWRTPPALKNVTITIPAGSSCALVGRSGSGKSTTFLALTGMIPIVSGKIQIDGIPCDRVALDTLRAALAVVPQDPVLFSGGLRSNLDPHQKHSDAELWTAIKVIGLEKAVQEVGGLETDPIASGMSQGQRQLLCLARALLRDTVLLLLDEANASLDMESEIILAETVKKFASGEVGVIGTPRKRTVVEVAHRLRSVVENDQVVVLSAGEVIENGVPSELAKKEGGVFQGMLKAQGLV